MMYLSVVPFFLFETCLLAKHYITDATCEFFFVLDGFMTEIPLTGPWLSRRKVATFHGGNHAARVLHVSNTCIVATSGGDGGP